MQLEYATTDLLQQQAGDGQFAQIYFLTSGKPDGGAAQILDKISDFEKGRNIPVNSNSFIIIIASLLKNDVLKIFVSLLFVPSFARFVLKLIEKGCDPQNVCLPFVFPVGSYTLIYDNIIQYKLMCSSCMQQQICHHNRRTTGSSLRYTS